MGDIGSTLVVLIFYSTPSCLQGRKILLRWARLRFMMIGTTSRRRLHYQVINPFILSIHHKMLMRIPSSRLTFSSTLRQNSSLPCLFSKSKNRNHLPPHDLGPRPRHWFHPLASDLRPCESYSRARLWSCSTPHCRT